MIERRRAVTQQRLDLRSPVPPMPAKRSQSADFALPRPSGHRGPVDVEQCCNLFGRQPLVDRCCVLFFSAHWQSFVAATEGMGPTMNWQPLACCERLAAKLYYSLGGK